MADLSSDTDGRIREVIERQSPTVYRLAYASMKNRSDAEDIFQEVFLRYLKAKPDFASAEHEKAWFIRVAANCAKRLFASAWRRRVVALEEEPPAPSPEAAELSLALFELPAKYRLPLHLFYYEGYATEEIAVLLGLKPSALRMRLSRGRAMLREKLKGEYFDESP